MEIERHLRCAVSASCPNPPDFYCKDCSGTPVYYCKAHKQTHLSRAGEHSAKLVSRTLSRSQLDGCLDSINSNLAATESGIEKLNTAFAKAMVRLNKLWAEQKAWLEKRDLHMLRIKKSVLQEIRIFHIDEDELNLFSDAEIERKIRIRCRNIRKAVDGLVVVEENGREQQNPIVRRESNASNCGGIRMKDLVFSEYASNDYKIRLLAENNITVEIRPNDVKSVIILKNQKYAIIWKKKKALEIFDLKTKAKCLEMKVPGKIQALLATEDSSTLIASVQKNDEIKVLIFDITTKDLIQSQAIQSRIDFIHEFPEKVLLLYSWDAMVFTYDLKTHTVGEKLPIYSRPKVITAVLHTRDFSKIICGGPDGHIRSCFFEPFATHKDFAGVNTTIKCLSLTEDNRILMAGTSSGTIGVWQLESARNICIVSLSSRPVAKIMSSVNSSCFMAANDENLVRVYGVHDGKIQKELKKKSEIQEAQSEFPKAECFEERIRN
jgi:uncharacterized protein YecT (DUF1311 family)